MLKSMFIESMNQPITNWLNLNYIASKDSSIPRCIIYQHYCEDFKKEGIEPLNTAMFGKVIKMAFPFIRSRRLGNRGNSKYHYFGVTARSGAVTLQPAEENMSEKAFIQKYESMQKLVLGQLLGNEYVKAYQEMKRFWTEHMSSFVSSKNLEKMCLSVEKHLFSSLIKKNFPPDVPVNFSDMYLNEKISLMKTSAKTISVLCRQLLSVTHNKGIMARLEIYKAQSIVLNRTGNLYRCASILEEKHKSRDSLAGFVSLLGSGLCVLQNSISLEKSHIIHVCVTTLISYYINTASFYEFILGIDDVVSDALCKKERIQCEEMHGYFSGVIQEVLCSRFSSVELASVLCTFFSEYFSIVSSSVPHEPLFKKKRALAFSDAKVSSEHKSFVSQIITQC
ncbi:hypothetical protein NECID01_0976 [Nematocida sp. AWRm77]|nr:hypothetical protein NECID01_0976 [Nematocida sp. AWRm77]